MVTVCGVQSALITAGDVCAQTDICVTDIAMLSKNAIRPSYPGKTSGTKRLMSQDDVELFGGYHDGQTAVIQDS